MKYVILMFILALYACNSNENQQVEIKSHPSHIYTYTDIDSSSLKYYETDYVPVYSDIYHRDGTRRFLLTTTISIRNNSLVDSAYILRATYYDSYGKELHDYIDSTILLSPLESIEFVVEETEDIGGAGANFIINWAAKEYSDQILIQSIMIGSYGQQGISFLSNSKVIKSVKKK
ncbi:MAG: DUF3124 domain-containing protein [Bacteroidales bacterium]|jgi:hypothetical protein|nr:DUF3124 domain-containing protein [Bacteroidales bacterium]